jgi:hypothetical protein
MNNSIKSILFLLITVIPVAASHLGLSSVKQPIYLLGTEYDSTIQITSVPFATSGADPEWKFNAICQPFVPPTDGSWKEPHDVNLTSLYGISVAGTYKEGGRDIEVIVDASKAKIPPNYPFTLDQVLDAVVTCVKLMSPAKPEDEGTLEIKIVRKVGEDQDKEPDSKKAPE